MSKIIGFIKANLVVVISIVMILAFLPTGYIFAKKWNAKVYEKASAAYNKEKRALTSAGKITYALPAVLEGEEDLSETRAPNHAVTKFYQTHKTQREEQVQEVVDRGTAFNRGDHVELVPGILPRAADDRTLKRLGREMAEAIVGTNASSSVYQRKLQRLNAGSPPDPESLQVTLEDFKTREQQRYENASADGKMTAIQTEQLNKDLIARRLGEYIGRAKSLTFYCTPEAFVDRPQLTSGRSSVGQSRGGGAKSSYSTIPAVVPSLSTIDEAMIFNWLWDYWIISDVLEAAALANQDPISGAMSIPEAPVKRIESIRISKIELDDASAQNPDDDSYSGSRNRRSARDDDDASPSTFTQRIGGEPDSAYDIRMIELVVIASSQDLPRFIDAIGKTNYMTVTDLDLEEVDVWDDLGQGYYYGDKHVVRATIAIESVWLRSWLKPIMPDRIKTAMGIPLDDGLDEFEDSDG